MEEDEHTIRPDDADGFDDELEDEPEEWEPLFFGEASWLPFAFSLVGRVAVGFGAGFLGCLFVLATVLKIVPAPWWPMFLAGAVGATRSLLVPGPARWPAVRLDADGLVLSRQRWRAERLRIAYGDVRLISGEEGLSLSGGEMRVPKRIRIATADGVHTLQLGPAHNRACYEQLVRDCPDAVGIGFLGQVRLDAPQDRAECRRRIESVEPMVLGEFRRRIRTAALAGAGLSLATIAVAMLLVLGFVRSEAGASVARGGVFLVCLAAGAVVYLGMATRQLRLRGRVRRVLDAVKRELAVRPMATAGPIVLGPAPKAPARPVSGLGRVATLLAVATCCVPLLGLPFSVPAFLLTRRSPGGYRKATLVALVVSLTWTLCIALAILID